MTKYLRISPYIRRPSLIYDLASLLNFLRFEEKFLLYFNSIDKRPSTVLQGTSRTTWNSLTAAAVAVLSGGTAKPVI
jgi:hypothetical protein